MIMIKRVVVLIIVVMAVCLIHQLTIFILFNEPPRLEIFKVSNDYKNEEIKRIWRGNYLDIEAATPVYICEQPTYARFEKDRIEIYEFYCHNVIPCWGFDVNNYNYKLHYNNIFSSLKVYLLDDIKISVGHSDCDVGDVNDKEYMKSKGFIYLYGNCY